MKDKGMETTKRQGGCSGHGVGLILRQERVKEGGVGSKNHRV